MPAEILTPFITGPFSPRFGQWVRFKPPAPVPYAHVDAEGYTVGIFTGPQRPSPAILKTIATVQANSNAPPDTAKQAEQAIADLTKLLPARIMVVDADGCNLPRPQVKGVPQGSWWFALDQVQDLRPLEVIDHMPPGREVHPDWKPVA